MKERRLETIHPEVAAYQLMKVLLFGAMIA
jgi:hypothetical protein